MNRDQNGNIAVGSPGSYARKYHEILEAASTPFWVKRLLPEIDQKDPVDVLNCLEGLKDLFERKIGG